MNTNINAKSLQENFTNAAQQVGEAAKEKLSKFKDTVEEGAYHMGEKTRQYFEESRDIVTEGTEYVEAQVKAHPVATIGVVFLLGWLVGRLNCSK